MNLFPAYRTLLDLDILTTSGRPYSDYARAGWSGVRIPIGARDFSLLQTSTPVLKPIQAQMGTGIPSRGGGKVAEA
jgi:hypothetical protein